MVQRSSFVCFLLAIISFCSLVSSGCAPTRPKNIPIDTTYVDGGKTNWWQRCTYDKDGDVDRCQIFNAGGKTLYDEVFLPYDGRLPAKPSELEINGSSLLAGPSIVCLKNGRILLPKSTFDSQKKFVDAKLEGR